MNFHIESKIRAALARDGQPGSDIQPLVDRCDWASLATVLKNDRLLTTQLFSKGEETERSIQRGISRIQKKYFREFTDSSTFVISKYASKMSAKAVRDGTAETASNDFAPAPPPPYSELHKGDEGFCYDEKGHEKASKTGPT